MVRGSRSGALQMLHRVGHSYKTNQIRQSIDMAPTATVPRVMSQDLYRATMEDFINLLSKPPTDTFVGTVEQT
jgi:hypothetical protein